MMVNDDIYYVHRGAVPTLSVCNICIHLYTKASKPQVKSFARVKSFSVGGLGVYSSARPRTPPAHATSLLRLTRDRHPQHFLRIDKRPPYRAFVYVLCTVVQYTYILRMDAPRGCMMVYYAFWPSSVVSGNEYTLVEKPIVY